jgi:hypothetical protein
MGVCDDPALVEAIHRSWLRGVLVQGEVRSATVVVGKVVAQQDLEHDSGHGEEVHRDQAVEMVIEKTAVRYFDPETGAAISVRGAVAVSQAGALHSTHPGDGPHE